jgi:DNA-directed RNA polymerase specialized sigma24 family protein
MRYTIALRNYQVRRAPRGLTAWGILETEPISCEGREHFVDAHARHARSEGRPVHTVAIPYQVATRRLPGNASESWWAEARTSITEGTGDVPSVDALLAAAEEHVALLGCVRQLAEVQRLVLTMRVLEELSPAEVARTLGLTPVHVGVLLYRAKRALMDCMERGRAEEASLPGSR